jgi:hypothetical protein
LAAEVDLTNPQKMGSAITYFRRYALAAISQTVADEDDDGNEAAKPGKKSAVKKLTGHEVVQLHLAINSATTVEDLALLLRGQAYQMLKSNGPEDIYEKTAALAKAKHALLSTPPAEQAGEDDEPKPF